VVGLEKTTEIGTTVSLDIVFGLQDIDAIEVISEAKIGEGVGLFIGETMVLANASVDVFGNSLVGAGKGKAINLTTKEDLGVFVSGDVYILFVGGGFKIEFLVLKEGIDVFLPTHARFRVAL
jgi:hypothetical protein